MLEIGPNLLSAVVAVVGLLTAVVATVRVECLRQDHEALADRVALEGIGGKKGV